MFRHIEPRCFVVTTGSGGKPYTSGVIGDYVMRLTVGTAVIGGVWAVTLR